MFSSRDENKDLFDLTCGGFGLTGIVLSVGIKLGKLTSNMIETETIPVEDIFQLPRLFNECSTKFDLLYSWHEFNSQTSWGHGFLKVGRQINSESNGICDLSSLTKAKPLVAADRGRNLPLSLLCPTSVWLMNWAYLHKELGGRAKSIEPLVEFLFPVLRKTIYFDLFGRAGFHESQVLIPFDQFESVMKQLKFGLKKFNTPVTLASCKLFSGQPELLRFIGEGIVLAMNFPRNDTSLKLLDWWDRVVIEARGLPNIAKDSRLQVGVIQNCYPNYHLFSERLQKWDPKRRFQSSVSQRLCL